jgi:uncharacterized protein YndB with AHSA1/START domain
VPEQLTQDVVRSVTVAAPAHCVFAVFTQQMSDWWPDFHKLVGGERVAVAVEPREGGRWYERAADGSEADWGRVLEWDPPNRIVLTWRIDGRWQPLADDTGASEIEVTFTPQGFGSTVVQLSHTALHRLGEYADGMRKALDTPGPGGTLGAFAKAF